MQVRLRSLALFFVGYNLILAGTLLGPLTMATPPQRVVTLSNGDFTPLTIPNPNETDQVSKPFHADTGEVIATHLEVWGVDNASGRISVVEYGPSVEYGPCSACQVYVGIVGLNGGKVTLVGNFMFNTTYDVIKPAEYVILFRPAVFLQGIPPNCTTCKAGISGTLTIMKPESRPFYEALPVPLVAIGATRILISVVLAWRVRLDPRPR